MKTLNLGIELDQGADFEVIIGIFGDGGPIDITGYSFLGKMKSSTSPTAPVIAEFTFAIQNQFTNKGQVQMKLDHATNAAIATSIATALTKQRFSTPFIFDVKMKDLVGTEARIIQGIIYISPQATSETFP